MNLDTMNEDELEKIICNKSCALAIRAYAALKHLAINKRLVGKIDDARDCDDICDNIFNDLIPDELRW